MAAGGKGANQAVAAARLGASVVFIARVGHDAFGAGVVKGFEREGIDTRFIVRDPDAPSGVALIGVDRERGENSIIVAPGANARLTPADVERAADVIAAAQIVVCQLEVPLDAVGRALELARASGVTTILNPAPAQSLPSDLLALVSILTPNETEAALLAGQVGLEPREAARALLALGVSTVIVTLGGEGALLATGEGERLIPGCPVARVVNTTAAGDCFTGALAISLAEGQSLESAIAFANKAASISVTRVGAQPSLPTRADVEA